jgi:hypothetical protein
VSEIEGHGIKIQFADDSNRRRCGGCTLCCKVVPQKELKKAAGTRCKYQRTGHGCTIYAQRPTSCRHWNCVWLGGEVGTEHLSRPDRAGYVIDIMPDFVTARNNETGDKQIIPVSQIWVDAARPNSHRDPELRAYLAARGEIKGEAALIRFGNDRAMVLFPPALTPDGQWHEVWSAVTEKEHRLDEVVAAVKGVSRETSDEPENLPDLRPGDGGVRDRPSAVVLNFNRRKRELL